MIAILLMLGLSVLVLTALLILSAVAFGIAGDYVKKNGKDK